MQKSLDLTIRMENEWLEVDVFEPESGECSQFSFPLSFDEHPAFDEAIGTEIYSWLSLWADEYNDK